MPKKKKEEKDKGPISRGKGIGGMFPKGGGLLGAIRR